MFKKEFGISVYPEKTTISETKKYILKAKEFGYKNLFISFVQFQNPKKFSQVKNDYLKIIKFAKKQGFYVIANISESTLAITKSSHDDLSWFSKNGIDCIRLSTPFLAYQVAQTTHINLLDVQLNMSLNDHFVNNVLDYQPVLDAVSGSHNFYSKKDTGLGWDFFAKSTRRYVNEGLKTIAFIGSHFGKIGPQDYEVNELVTLESHRFKPIRTQAKELIASNLISNILIGNQPATDQELLDVSSIDLRSIELDIELENNLSPLEKEILLQTSHVSRGAVNNSFVRSTAGRVLYSNREDIKPETTQQTYQRGDIVVINYNDRNYQKELIIINQDNFTGLEANQGNLVGKIKDYDLDLFSLIKPWDYFKFRVVKA